MRYPDNKPLTPPQLQEVLHYPSGDVKGRALMREIRARERVSGVQIIHRSPGKGTRQTVTIGALRLHAPDLLPSEDDERRDEALELLRQIRERIEEETDDAVGRSFAQRIKPSLARFSHEVARLEHKVKFYMARQSASPTE